MSETYRVVKLQQNRLYPTYQLHALMASKKTAPQDGLRLAGLVVMDWLRQRLGDHVPEQLQRVPEPSGYLRLGDDCLPSIHIHSGFVADIVSLPKEGVWTLQLTEPDLGSDPGNPEQARAAVPGRVIETNIGFRIRGAQLECGFQTVISDPEGTAPEAEVYRLSVVRQLIDHPDFGLQQITRLGYEPTELTTAEQLKTLSALLKDEHNQLPCVIFTHPRTENPVGTVPDLTKLTEGISLRPLPTSAKLPAGSLKLSTVQTAVPVPYDTAAFAHHGVGLCRTYVLADELFQRFTELFKCKAAPGDILFLEPARFGGACRVLPYKSNPARQKQTMDELTASMYIYPRGKNMDFGQISFLSAAREDLLSSSEQAMAQCEALEKKWKAKLAEAESRWQARLAQKEAECHALTEQLDRQKQYQTRLEQEKDTLAQEKLHKDEEVKLKLATRDEEIAYLRRKLRQPKDHAGIADWVAQEFPDRLVLHQRAINLLADKSAKTVSCELICDALDYLATDHWAGRYERIPRDELLRRCSEKYGRPFEIKHISTTTIEHTPIEYKIKYFPGPKGKLVESALDCHLCVGNDPENLLRIYFLHDDQKKRIVVGSLPRHLRAIYIKA